MHFVALLILAAAPANTGSKPPKPALVCKAEPVTGTRFTKRVCRPKSQADDEAAASQRAADDMLNRPAINPASNGG